MHLAGVLDPLAERPHVGAGDVERYRIGTRRPDSSDGRNIWREWRSCEPSFIHGRPGTLRRLGGWHESLEPLNGVVGYDGSDPDLHCLQLAGCHRFKDGRLADAEDIFDLFTRTPRGRSARSR